MTSVVDLLTQAHALLLNDHIIGTSGRHLAGYVHKDALFMHTELTSEIGKQFARQLLPYNVDVVAGPAMGGIILSQWTAYHLTQQEGREVLSVYAEKKETDLVFKRGYDVSICGKRVAVVEDATTTGGSLKKVVDAATRAGAEVVVCSVMVNRDPERVTEAVFGVPFVPLTAFNIASYDEDACPMCAAGMPINTTVGHGKDYLAKKASQS